MIHFGNGNLFDCNAEALVNTVNTVGVMGKGVALQFREKFPLNYELYKKACDNGQVVVGKMFVTTTNSMINPKWIINFPTKQHWLHKSSYSYIEKGLDDLIKIIAECNITSVALPPLGAGQGGLDWQKVKNIINQKLSSVQAEIYVFEPNYWPATSPKGISEPLSKARALILALMENYRSLGYDISLLEIQKLAYFLQRVGISDLKLNFRKYYYGPYAHNLQHLLHRLENGYIITDKPVLDSKPFDTIYLNTSRINEIVDFIDKYCSETEKLQLQLVQQIIQGYQSPFGLELLASVDWIIKEHNLQQSLPPETILLKIQEWSDRKAGLFTLDQINAANKQLLKFSSALFYAGNPAQLTA